MKQSSDVMAAVHAELWRRGELSFLLHESQKDVYTRLENLPKTVRHVVVLISRRWGKSYLGAVRAMEKCLRKPRAQVGICAPSLKHAGNIIVPIIRDLASRAPDGLIRHTKSAMRWEFANGSALILGGFDTAIESFRGLFFDDIILEESGLANPNEYEYTISSVLLPTLAHSRGRITHLTTPSVIADHPLHTKTIPKAQDEHAYFEKTVYDNPLLSAEVIEELKRETGGETSAAWQREFLVRIIRDIETVVIPEFKREVHVCEPNLPARMNWTLAADFGFARDLAAAVLMYYDFERARTVVWDARVWPRSTHTRTIVEDLKAMEAHWRCQNMARYIDEVERVRADIAAEHNYPLAHLLKDDKDAQLNNLRVAFSQQKIEIHPRCEHLLNTLENGRWNKQRTDFERTETLGHCDSLMALCYGFRMLNKSNPFPPGFGLNPYTHNVPHRSRESENALASAFTPTF